MAWDKPLIITPQYPWGRTPYGTLSSDKILHKTVLKIYLMAMLRFYDWGRALDAVAITSIVTQKLNQFSTIGHLASWRVWQSFPLSRGTFEIVEVRGLKRFNAKICVADLHVNKRNENSTRDFTMMNQMKMSEYSLQFVFWTLWKVVKEVVLLFSCFFSLMWTN